jgi:hypothetical protein
VTPAATPKMTLVQDAGSIAGLGSIMSRFAKGPVLSGSCKAVEYLVT